MIQGITFSILMLALSGCFHVGRVPAPTAAWMYVPTNDQEADICLELSVSCKNHLDILKREIYFKRTERPTVNGVCQTVTCRQGGLSVFADGPSGNWCNSSVTPKMPTPSGVSFHILCSYSENKQQGNFASDIFVPYLIVGSSINGDLRYSWKWIIQRRPTSQLP